MSVRVVDGHVHFGPVKILIVERSDHARRLVSHLITRGRDFTHDREEQTHYICVSEDLNLELVRRTLPTVEFRVEECE